MIILHLIHYIRKVNMASKMYSTETASLEFIDRIVHVLDTGELRNNIYLDLSKLLTPYTTRFSSTNWTYYGIDGIPLNWFHNYRTNRTLFVQIEDIWSKSLPITSGVPQGSIRWPLLPIHSLYEWHTNDILKIKFILVNAPCSVTLTSSPSSTGECFW